MRNASHIIRCRNWRKARRRMAKAWRHLRTDAAGYLDEIYRHEVAWLCAPRWAIASANARGES